MAKRSKKQNLPRVPKPPEPITVAQLVDDLKQLLVDDPTMGAKHVVMAADPEGNSFRYLPHDVSRAYSGGRFVPFGYSGGDLLGDGEFNVLALWPM